MCVPPKTPLLPAAALASVLSCFILFCLVVVILLMLMLLQAQAARPTPPWLMAQQQQQQQPSVAGLGIGLGLGVAAAAAGVVKSQQGDVAGFHLIPNYGEQGVIYQFECGAGDIETFFDISLFFVLPAHFPVVPDVDQFAQLFADFAHKILEYELLYFSEVVGLRQPVGIVAEAQGFFVVGGDGFHQVLGEVGIEKEDILDYTILFQLLHQWFDIIIPMCFADGMILEVHNAFQGIWHVVGGRQGILFPKKHGNDDFISLECGFDFLSNPVFRVVNSIGDGWRFTEPYVGIFTQEEYNFCLFHVFFKGFGPWLSRFEVFIVVKNGASAKVVIE